MKRILVSFVLLFSIWITASAQDEEDNSYWYDEEWINYQQQLINEGYATIFDTDAYQNGDYYIRDDGRIALGENPNDYIAHPTTEEERQKTERDWHEWQEGYYSGYMGNNSQNYKPTPTPKTAVTWKCVDATSYDGIANNDNKCTSSTGQVKYVSDSEARKLDPKYKPGKSGAWYYNNK